MVKKHIHFSLVITKDIKRVLYTEVFVIINHRVYTLYMFVSNMQ